MDQEDILGQMVESIVENGLIIKCMEQVYFNGVMEECMWENILMIKSMDKEYLSGKLNSIFFRPDGKKYIGYWSEGKYNGRGIFIAG